MSDASVAEQLRRWRQKAEEIRTQADQIQNPFARLSLQRMARTYDRLADEYESRAAGKPLPKPDVG